MDHESESDQVRTLPQTSTSTPASWFSPERPSYKWWVTVALMLGILTQGLNFGTVNVALPSMMTSLQAEIENGFPFGGRPADDAQVVSQSHGPGSMVDRGTTIILRAF